MHACLQFWKLYSIYIEHNFIVNACSYNFCTDSEADDNIAPRFRQYIKEKRFQLKDFGSYGLQNVLVVPAHQNKAVSKSPHVSSMCIYMCTVCL